MKHKPLHIGQEDFLLANRKASREEEISLHGKQIRFRPTLFKSKKKYSRKQKHK